RDHLLERRVGGCSGHSTGKLRLLPALAFQRGRQKRRCFGGSGDNPYTLTRGGGEASHLCAESEIDREARFRSASADPEISTSVLELGSRYGASNNRASETA